MEGQDVYKNKRNGFSSQITYRLFREIHAFLKVLRNAYVARFKIQSNIT